MIGVGENDRSAQLFQRFLRQPFDSGRRAHRHERRRLDHTVRCAELAAPRGRPRILLLYFKRKTHLASVSGENPSPPYAAHHVNGAADAAFFGVRWLATAFTPVTSPRRLAKPRASKSQLPGNSGTAASNSRVYACPGWCRICSTAPVSSNLPARITATRVATC